MSAAKNAPDMELVVAEDGSIPIDQLQPLGLVPGTHLRVFRTDVVESGGTLAASLSDFPDLAWEDFERASKLARQDVRSARGSLPTRTPSSRT